MTDKEKLPEWIDRFTNNELEGEDLQKFLDMLRSDPELREEVKLDHDLNEILRDEDILDLRQKLMERKNRTDLHGPDLRQLLIAASVLLLIGISLLLYYTVFQNDDESSNQHRYMVVHDTAHKHPSGVTQNTGNKLEKNETPDTSKDVKRTVINPGDHHQLASNYTTYPAFESLVGTAMRSADFKLIAPAGSRIRKGIQIRFQWKTSSTGFISLNIMDNKGNLVYAMKPGTNQSQEIDKNRLVPGLYYFKFLGNDEIIYFGKFIIE